MKTFFAATVLAMLSVASAWAADVTPRPVYTKAPLAMPFSWTGCYAGVNVGGAWGKVSDFDPTALTDRGSNTPTGVLGGGQAGCDYQTGNVVLGAEGMFAGTDLKGSNAVPGTPAFVTSNKADWLATATARAGYAMDKHLLYVKGGGAWLNEKLDLTLAGVPNATGRFTLSGYVVGGGWEWAFAPGWSTKIEYNYLDFGNETQTICQFAGPCGPLQVKQTSQAVTGGLNYRFNWGGPLIGKY